MPRVPPRDVHIASVVGGGVIGLVLMVVGALLFSAASAVGGSDVLPDFLGGAAAFGVGAALVIVSVILLPGRRARQSERAPST